MLKDKTWQIPSETIKTTTSFTYDGDGGRVLKKSGLSPQGTVPDFFSSTTYIGSLYEIRNTDNGIRTVCHVFNGSNRAFTIDHRPSTIDCHFYHSDHLGSSNIITDNQGNIAQLLECKKKLDLIPLFV